MNATRCFDSVVIRIVACVPLMWGLVAAAPASAQDTATTPKWGPHVDFEGKAGTKRHIGEADLFAPLMQTDTSLLFADVRARHDNNASSEGNFGLGVRHMHESGWNLGAYGFFDRRRSQYDHTFNQATIGLEAMSLEWDVRANGYIPLGTRIKRVDGLNTATLSGTSVIFRGGEEHALGGFDGEIGWLVPMFAPDADRQMRLYLGGYRFTSNNVPTVQGPRARLELTIKELPKLWPGARLTLGAETQHDSPRGSQGFLSARLRVPLDLFAGGRDTGTSHRSLTMLEQRMTDPIVRDVDVVTQAGAFGAEETATQTASGQTITVLNSSSTTGAGLPAAVAAAGANSTVILSGTFNTTATTTMQTGQTVIGGGTLTVSSPSGRTATLSLSTATVSASIAGVGAAATNPGFMMATNSTLSGLNIGITRSAGVGAYGVYANSISGATITNSTITGTETGANTAIGLALSNSTNITISGNTISATSGGTTATSLAIVNTSTATVSGNTLNATGGSTNNYNVFFNTGTALSGSTGNVKGSGTSCNNTGATGTVYFTDSTTCP